MEKIDRNLLQQQMDWLYRVSQEKEHADEAEGLIELVGTLLKVMDEGVPDERPIDKDSLNYDLLEAQTEITTFTVPDIITALEGFGIRASNVNIMKVFNYKNGAWMQAMADRMIETGWSCIDQAVIQSCLNQDQ